MLLDLVQQTFSIFNLSSSLEDIRATQKFATSCIVPLLPADRRYSFMQLTQLTQTDSYNCGVYVLMWFEMHVSAPQSPRVEYDNKRAVQYFKYRYMIYILFGADFSSIDQQ